MSKSIKNEIRELLLKYVSPIQAIDMLILELMTVDDDIETTIKDAITEYQKEEDRRKLAEKCRRLNEKRLMLSKEQRELDEEYKKLDDEIKKDKLCEVCSGYGVMYFDDQTCSFKNDLPCMNCSTNGSKKLNKLFII